MGAALRQTLLAQYAAHRSWSVRLHCDNLVALAEQQPELRPVPSYSTVRRFLATHGLHKRRPRTARQTAGALIAQAWFGGAGGAQLRGRACRPPCGIGISITARAGC